MGTRTAIFREQEDGSYKGIYVALDGGAANTGVTLIEHYQDGSKIQELIDQGQPLSFLGAETLTFEKYQIYNREELSNAYREDLSKLETLGFDSELPYCLTSYSLASNFQEEQFLARNLEEIRNFEYLTVNKAGEIQGFDEDEKHRFEPYRGSDNNGYLYAQKKDNTWLVSTMKKDVEMKKFKPLKPTVKAILRGQGLKISNERMLQESESHVMRYFENENQKESEQIMDKQLEKTIDLQTIQFDLDYDGDDQKMGKIPWDNLELKIDDVEPNSWSDDGKLFVRASLADNQDGDLVDVIHTPFIIERPDEGWEGWYYTHADKVENVVFSNKKVQELLQEIEFRKLSEAERQEILDQENGVIDLFDESADQQEKDVWEKLSESGIGLTEREDGNVRWLGVIDWNEDGTFIERQTIQELFEAMKKDESFKTYFSDENQLTDHDFEVWQKREEEIEFDQKMKNVHSAAGYENELLYAYGGLGKPTYWGTIGEVLRDPEMREMIDERGVENLYNYVMDNIRDGGETSKEDVGSDLFINPTKADFQRANVRIYDLPQNANLEEFTKENQVKEIGVELLKDNRESFKFFPVQGKPEDWTFSGNKDKENPAMLHFTIQDKVHPKDQWMVMSVDLSKNTVETHPDLKGMEHPLENSLYQINPATDFQQKSQPKKIDLPKLGR